MQQQAEILKKTVQTEKQDTNFKKVLFKMKHKENINALKKFEKNEIPAKII